MDDVSIRNLTDDELVHYALNSRYEDNLVRELAERLSRAEPHYEEEF